MMTANVLSSELSVDEEVRTAKWTALSSQTTNHRDPMASVTMSARSTRMSIRLLVSFEANSSFYVGMTDNLSEGGVFIATRGVQSVGSRVDLGIQIPEQEPLRVRGTVIWQRSSGPTPGALPGMGIRFDDLSAYERARIRDLIDAQEDLAPSMREWDLDPIA
jgi:uncharacterized protein (TIGR02266 family)